MNSLHFHVLSSKQQMFNHEQLEMLALTCSHLNVSALFVENIQILTSVSFIIRDKDKTSEVFV